jgi:hypothetical protein
MVFQTLYNLRYVLSFYTAIAKAYCVGKKENGKLNGAF